MREVGDVRCGQSEGGGGGKINGRLFRVGVAPECVRSKCEIQFCCFVAHT